MLDLLIRSKNGDILDFEWGRIVWLVSRNLGNSTEMTFGYVTIKAGAANPRHRHPNCDEILYLISGRVEHSLDSDRLEMEAGDTVSIPMGVVHNARALGDQDAEMIIAFSSADCEAEVE